MGDLSDHLVGLDVHDLSQTANSLVQVREMGLLNEGLGYETFHESLISPAVSE